MSLDTHLQTIAAQMAELNAAFAAIINEAAHDLRYGKNKREEIADRMDRQMREAREFHHKEDSL